MLEVTNLSVSIARTNVLHDVALNVPAGETAGLIGRNGAGKTTFMRSVMGLLPVQGGEIRFDGLVLTDMPAHRRAHLRVGYMPEDRRLVPELTVEENILLPVWATRRTEDMKRLDWIYELIAEVADFRTRRALQLSGGQQKLVALARALICGSKLLLLDEPFEGVAPVLSRRLVKIVARLKDEGVSVLLSESDYTHSSGLVDHLFVIERGVITERDVTGVN